MTVLYCLSVSTTDVVRTVRTYVRTYIRTYSCIRRAYTYVLYQASVCLIRAYQAKQPTVCPLEPGRSTMPTESIIDRIGPIIESIESNLTKNPNFLVSVFRRFCGLQASYGAETLTQDRSRGPRRGEKIEKSAKLSNRSNRSTRSSDRAIDRIDRRPP